MKYFLTGYLEETYCEKLGILIAETDLLYKIYDK